MQLLIDKNRLLELISDPDAGIKAHKLLAYTFSNDEGVFRKVLESLLTEIKEKDFASYEVLVITNLLRNYNANINDIPLLLTILREVKGNIEEPKLNFAGIFTVIALCLKMDFDELEKNKSIFGEDEIGSHIWEYIVWIQENRNGNSEELQEELISITRRLTEELSRIETETAVDEVLEDLQEQVTDFKSLLITKKNDYYPLIYNSLKELTETENYILQDLSIEMAGIWKAIETIPFLVEIARMAEPELSVYQQTIDALSLMQAEEIFPFAEDMFRFQEDSRVSFAEILGHYPFDLSEEILLKYLYKEKDKDIVTLCAWALSNQFSLKSVTAIKEVADKGKLNPQMIPLNEILLPIYIYHKLPIPDWMREIEEHSHNH
ncbi:MAG: hypothetical protein IPL26_29220 [Leptospiraceae bacterium]|nr:hypothetical protein [Leptospiraceae bacterium]